MGVRDISVISTPPEERRPIITYISEFDDNIVVEAVRKELKRKGQIFFIHNNIHSIDSVAERLEKLLPEANVGVAHGRMKENKLEDIMLKFIDNEIDLLVCTTIVESGLDIATANTILVNRADRFGLGARDFFPAALCAQPVDRLAGVGRRGGQKRPEGGRMARIHRKADQVVRVGDPAHGPQDGAAGDGDLHRRLAGVVHQVGTMGPHRVQVGQEGLGPRREVAQPARLVEQPLFGIADERDRVRLER